MSMPIAEINVQQIYIAYYGRPADPAGLAFWTEYFSTTDNLDDALAAFGASAEFTDRYGALAPTELVNGLYRQLFNRDADPEGLTFYLELLASGDATLASIALDIANGAQNSDRTALDNKIAVATHSTDVIETTGADYGPAEIDAAQALLAAVGATAASLRAGIAASDDVFAPEPTPPTPPTPTPPTPTPPTPTPPVTDTTAPVFSSGATATVAENADINTVVYDANATDAGGAADAGITYTLSGTDVALFSIDAGNGEVRLLASADFESGKTSYTLEITATDAANNATTQTVAVTVTDVDDEAPVFSSGPTATVPENAGTTTLVYDANATDNNGAVDTGITYTLSGTDADAFKIDAASGVVTLNGRADFETTSRYALDVIATDAAGNATTQAVMVTVTDVDEIAPVFSGGASAEVEVDVPENTPTTTVLYDANATDAGNTADVGITYRLLSTTSGTDADAFTIDAASGEVRLKAPVDFESAKTSYELLVVAIDAAGNNSHQTLTVNVTDVNDAPTGVPIISGTPTQGETLTADISGISDADGLGTFSYQWQAGGTAISGATDDTLILTQAEVGAVITVVVSYTDNGNTAETLTSDATPAVTNSNDDPEGTVTISGTPTQGETLTAVTSGITDADGPDTLTFSYQCVSPKL